MSGIPEEEGGTPPGTNPEGARYRGNGPGDRSRWMTKRHGRRGAWSPGLQHEL